MAEHTSVVLADDGYPLDKIELTRVSAQGSHGVLPAEQAGSQLFSADVALYLDTRQAAVTDQISHATDYSAVATAVHNVLAGPHVDLIETLAERIAAAILEFPGVQVTDVVVHKSEAPLPVPVADVSVAIRRDHTHRTPAVPAPAVESDLAVVEPVENVAAAALVVEPDIPVVPAAAPVAPVLPVVALDETMIGAAPLVTPSLPAADPVTLLTSVFDQPPANPVKIILALGSNLGDSKTTLRLAVGRLMDTPGIQLQESGVGPLARTSPVGGPPGQPDFYNSVVKAQTTLSPNQVLAATQLIEAEFGRVRTGEKWAPRTLDIDIVAYGDLVGSDGDLTIPHPYASQRAFVLLPWSELEPDAEFPGMPGTSVAALADAAADRPGIRNMMLNWLEYVPAVPPEQTVAFEPDGLAPDGASAAGGDGFSGESFPVSAQAGPPATAMTPTPKLDLPEWTPGIPQSAQQDALPTFTGILTGVPAPSSAAVPPISQAGVTPRPPEQVASFNAVLGLGEGGAAQAPQAQRPAVGGGARSSSPLAARLAARIRGTSGGAPLTPDAASPAATPTPSAAPLTERSLFEPPLAEPPVSGPPVSGPPVAQPANAPVPGDSKQVLGVPSWDQIVNG